MSDYYLQHFGVLGMKWGRRKSESEQKLHDMKRAASSSNKARKVEIRKAEDEVGDALSGKSFKGKTDEEYFDNVSKAIGRRDALTGAHKAQVKVDKAAIRDQEQIVKAERNAAKAAKKLSKMAKFEEDAKWVREDTRAEIEDEVKRHKPENQAAKRAQLEKRYKTELNYTGEQVRKARIEAGIGIAAGTLLIVGSHLIKS